MNRKPTISSPDRNDGKMGRRLLLGMTAAGLDGALVAYAAAPNSSRTSPTPRRRFEGKVVLITGATSGIGRAAALQFAAEGAKVSFCGRREKLGQDAENEIRSRGGEGFYIRADVRNESDVHALVDQTVQKYGQLNVASNNAGITIERPLHEYSSEEWDDVVNTNLRGVFLALKYEIPHMLASGGGNVVVTSSSNAIATTEKRSAYAADWTSPTSPRLLAA